MSSMGQLVWIITKMDDVADAWEVYEATKSPDAAIEVATKISEIVAGIAAGYVVSTIVAAIQKTGLDRVFDSIRKGGLRSEMQHLANR